MRILGVWLALANAIAQAGTSPASPAPFVFEANTGRLASSTVFIARTRSYTVRLERSSVIFHPYSSPNDAVRPFRMRFLNTQSSVSIEGEQELDTPTRYFTSNATGPLTVPTFRMVRYRGLYPGIDVLFYQNGKDLEYDLEIAPGADPRQVKVSFEGVRSHRRSDGSVLLEGHGYEVVQHRPVAYELDGRERASVRSSHALRNGIVSFNVGARNPKRKLVIDPVIQVVRRLGGGGTDLIYDMKRDGAGNVYVAGETNSTDVAMPARSTSTQGHTAAWLMKLDPSGSQVLYRVFIDGTGDDTINSLAVDASGNLYAAGSTSSSFLSGFTGVGSGQEDAFVVKLNVTGAMVYGVYVGGSSVDLGLGITVHQDGKTTLTGQTRSPGLPVTANGLQTYPAGGSDCYITRLSGAGSIEWTRFLGGAGLDSCHAITSDAKGATFLTGSTESVNFPVTLGAYQPSRSGSTDAFIVKLSTNGAILWASYLGGGAPDTAAAIAIDSGGTLWVVGTTASVDFPTTSTALQRINAGGYDGFVAAVAADGRTLLYSTLIGQVGDDALTGCVFDANGRIAVAGFTSSSNLPVTDSLNVFSGRVDPIVALLHPSGSPVEFLAYLGGTGDDRATAVTLCGTQNLCVAGWTASTSFLNSVTEVESHDGFVVSVSPPPVPVPTAPATFVPTSGSAALARNTALTWSPVSTATSYDVYFGTANPPPFAATTSTTSYTPALLSTSTTYYWRVVSKNTYGSQASSVWSFTTAGIDANRDFNRDGKLDVIWQDQLSGWAQVWHLGGLQGATPTNAANLTASNTWRIVGTGDFNLDGGPDVVWQDPVTGAAQVWALGGPQGNLVQSAAVLSPGNPWRIRSIADFNRDGKPDAIWQDETSGWAQMWLMGGAQGNVLQAAINLTLKNPWRIVGVSDFNGDGTLDIVWQDPAIGTVQIWYMGGAQRNALVDAVNLPAPAPSYKVAAVFDMDSDGHPDIVLQHSGSGASVVWFLGGAKGNEVKGTASFSGPNSWRIMGPR